MTHIRVIVVIIALSVAYGFEYDYDLEYDWSRSRSSSPPKKEEVIPKPQVIVSDPKVSPGNPKLPDGSYKYRFPSSTTTTTTPKPTTKTKTLTVTRTTTRTTTTITTSRTTTKTTSTSSTTTTAVYPSHRRPVENFLKAAYDLIPEDDRKKFGFLTIDEIHEIREAERELIFQLLKKTIQGDHLSHRIEENILGGFSKMLDLDNSTHVDTRAEAEGVNTTVRPEVVGTTDSPALDVEEDVNMTMPSTAVSVPDSVKGLTEADLKLANITGEI
jgi:hypothetical protein